MMVFWQQQERAPAETPLRKRSAGSRRSPSPGQIARAVVAGALFALLLAATRQEIPLEAAPLAARISFLR